MTTTQWYSGAVAVFAPELIGAGTCSITRTVETYEADGLGDSGNVVDKQITYYGRLTMDNNKIPDSEAYIIIEFKEGDYANRRTRFSIENRVLLLA